MKKADKESPEIADNGYILAGKNCGRDKDGAFRCVCGECKPEEENMEETQIIKITLKGRAFGAALDAGLVRPNIFGGIPLYKFERFWELFSPWLSEYADEYTEKENEQ